MGFPKAGPDEAIDLLVPPLKAWKDGRDYAGRAEDPQEGGGNDVEAGDAEQQNGQGGAARERGRAAIPEEAEVESDQGHEGEAAPENAADPGVPRSDETTAELIDKTGDEEPE